MAIISCIAGSLALELEMKKRRLLFKSFQTKVTLIIIISMLFVGAVGNIFIYRFAHRNQFNELRNKLKIIAQTAALMIDADMLTKVPLNREGVNTSEYKIISEKLEKIKKINLPIKYIYTLTKTDKKGIWQFIVDPTIITKEDKEKGLTSYPGDEYRADRFPEMLNSYNGPTADKKLQIDEWGITLSGYAPIRDENDRTVAILGVDIIADDVYKNHQEVFKREIYILILGAIVSILLGMIISRRINRPIKKLLRGICHLSKGDLDYQIEVVGDDEISGVSRSFNIMASKLYEYRIKSLNYFYRIVQSFVRILEAKDNYTRGHSERVSEYVEKIAFKMAYPIEKIKELKEVALLHDIGKLGIKEDILNKKEKLTEEEWEVIQTHPMVGEEILKPILTSAEMLTIVRQHHERYDGTGYPDNIGGDDINIMAAIVSVADAYDAMISPRAYRSALSKEKAIDEIKKNSGSQFNPKVVEVFLQIY